MGAAISIIRLLGPAILRGAEAGTLAEIAETAARLFTLLRPLLDEPETKAALDNLTEAAAGMMALRQAPPDDSRLALEGASRRGGA
jgi:hypothetical protein